MVAALDGTHLTGVVDRADRHPGGRSDELKVGREPVAAVGALDAASLAVVDGRRARSRA